MADRPVKEDLSFGQVAIRQGFATTEQIRECLEIQQRVRTLGAKPKMMGEILYEKGYLTADQINRVFEIQQAQQSQDRRNLSIPGFEIVSKIGQGGMGAVYKAHQVRMDRIVALKILPPRLAQDRQFVERFLNEARAVARLRHENIVLGIDAGEANGLYYFAMEYVQGMTASEILRREGRFDERRALSVAQQVARALQHAYEHHMIHRDIKPDNILITADGCAKLCDLGLAKEQKTDPGLTQAGLAVGTPHYISPEQARGESDIDTRSDIYALGATLYHLMVGEVPFTGANAAVVMTKHVTTPPTPPREKVPAISEAVSDLILKCMAKHREHRFQTPAALAQEIEQILAKPATAAARAVAPRGGEARASGPAPLAVGSPASLRRRSERRSPVGGLVAAAVVLVGGFALYTFLPSETATGPKPPPTKAPKTAAGGTATTQGVESSVPDEAFRSSEAEVNRFFAGNRTEDPSALYARLEAAAQSARGAASEKRYAALLDGFKGRVDTQSDDAWRAARTAGEDALRKGRLAEALARYREFPAALRAFRADVARPENDLLTRGGKESDAAVRDLQFQIRNRFLQHVQEIAQCLARGDTAQAWSIGLTMLPYTTSELSRESDPQLQSLPRQRDEQLCAILAKEIDALCEQKRFEAARAQCANAQKDDALPEAVRQKGAALLPEIAKRELERAGRDKQQGWSAYQTELAAPLQSALSARDIDAAKRLIAQFLYGKDERKGSLWVAGLDYPGRLRAALGPAPLAPDAFASLVSSVERALGTTDADAAQDPARAALLDVRAALLLDDLFRQAEATARAYAETRDGIRLESAQTMDRAVFPALRCQISVEKGDAFFFYPYGKSAPGAGFSIRKGGAGLLVEEDVAALAGTVRDASARRWKSIRGEPLMHLKIGILYFTCGKKDKQRLAALECESARRGGVPALQRYLSAAPSVQSPDRAVEVEEQLTLVRGLVQSANWPFARKEMNDLLDQYGSHPYFQEHRAEVQELQKRIDAHFKAR